MDIRSNAILAMILGLAISSQVCASGNERGNGDMPPPPPSFSSIDSDGNSEISVEEFSAQDLPQGDPETIFSEIDSNDDGVISEEEFASHKPPRPQQRQ
ncbi:EF-hand domain-containing protein [Psychromonas sp.]|uniref:EF-hand domain-containing protein n=1 Tax=Psychromonas sp. TaxID=1884585 RepID=UPI003568DC85